ncbi:hypothetical protein F4823DRAFT_205789 [Ustulina deusta]|nr:hypothetical protein F4823DRAFT_205789 [Ustulina deusta]
MACNDVGSTNPDIAGLGVLLNPANANNPVTLLPALISSRSSKLQPDQARHLRLTSDLIDRVLKTISDIQTLNGISLLIGAIAQHRTLSLYHYHIVYNTVNFTGVSMAAALVIVF